MGANRGAVQAALAQVQSANSNTSYGAWSPLVRQIEGYQGGQAIPLPRTNASFTSGAFGPLLPIIPQSIDVPLSEGGYAAPRRWQYPVGWNLPMGEPGTEGLKLASFQLLRSYAEMSSIARSCIDICKNDILSLDWTVKPTQQAAMALEGDPQARADFEKRKEIAVNFWRNVDRQRFPSFRQWLNAFLEDMIVLDAVAIYCHPTLTKNGGPFNSPFGSFSLLDGSTIKPLVDVHGTPPKPPETAYQQFLWGLPRTDLMNAVLSEQLTEDIVNEQLMKITNNYTQAELIYLRRNDRTQTIYGFGEVEQAIVPIGISLMRQQWQWSWFSAGSLPAAFMDPGPTVTTAEEARQIQEAINMMGGDLEGRHQMIVLPPGAKVSPQKDVNATDEFDEWVTAMVCMPFGLAITDLGITIKSAMPMNSSGAANANAQAAAKAEQRGLLPRVTFLKEAFFDRIIQDLWGQEDMEWDWGITGSGQNKQDKITQAISLAHGTITTIDEARVEIGKDPLGLPETQVPLVFTATGATPLATAVQLAIAQGQAAASAPAAPATPTPPLKPAVPSTPSGQAESGDMGEESPAHQAAEAVDSTDNITTSKSFGNELDILERYLRRGKDIKSFKAVVLDPKAIRVAGHINLPPDQTVKAVKDIMHHQVRRDTKLDPLRKDIQKKLAALVAKIRNGVMGGPQFIDQGHAILQQAMTQATAMGATDALQDSGSTMSLDDMNIDTVAMAQRRASHQLEFLAGMLAAIVGAGKLTRATLQGNAPQDSGTADDLESRCALYGETLTGGYEESYGTTTSATMGDPIGVWVAEIDGNTCDLCADRDGEHYTLEELPGWPGDGGYGNDDAPCLCEGGPACRCSIHWYDSNVGIAGDPVRITTNIGRADQVQTNMQVISDARLADAQAVASRDAQLATLAEADSRIEAVTGINPGIARRASERDTFMGVPGTVSRMKWEQEHPDVTPTGDWTWMEYNSQIAPPDVQQASRERSLSGVQGPYKSFGPTAPGLRAGALVVFAKESGRVLLQQRGPGEKESSNMWEFPGGHIDDGETPLMAGIREWQEEVGAELPTGDILGSWSNGVWQCYLVAIDSEDQVVMGSYEQHGDIPQAVQWYSFDELPSDLREELSTFPWADIQARTMTVKSMGDAHTNDVTPVPGDLSDHVYGYLSRHYPKADLTWVKKCKWSTQTIPLSKIAMARRPGGRDEAKVDQMVQAIQNGDELEAVILVKAGRQYVIADGYHRTDALKRVGIKSSAAHVAIPPAGLDWQTPIRNMQRDVNNKGVSPNEAIHQEAGWTPGTKLSHIAKSAGNAQALIDWYNSGADGQINWGEPGDFDDCVSIAGQYIDNPEGFCNLRHQDATGAPPGKAPSEEE